MPFGALLAAGDLDPDRASVWLSPGLRGAVLVLFVAMGMTCDCYSRRRIHAVYLWGGALLAIWGPATQVLSGTAASRAFAEAMIR